MYFADYNIYISKMYEIQEGKMEEHFYKILICKLYNKICIKIDCNVLKLYSINPNTATKTTKQSYNEQAKKGGNMET